MTASPIPFSRTWRRLSPLTWQHRAPQGAHPGEYELRPARRRRVVDQTAALGGVHPLGSSCDSSRKETRREPALWRTFSHQQAQHQAPRLQAQLACAPRGRFSGQGAERGPRRSARSMAVLQKSSESSSTRTTLSWCHRYGSALWAASGARASVPCAWRSVLPRTPSTAPADALASPPRVVAWRVGEAAAGWQSKGAREVRREAMPVGRWCGRGGHGCLADGLLLRRRTLIVRQEPCCVTGAA